jgi:putative transposase
MIGKFRSKTGEIFREFCHQRGVELLEGHLAPDHVHMCISIPPKFSIAFVRRFLKGKSAVLIHRTVLKEQTSIRSALLGQVVLCQNCWFG